LDHGEENLNSIDVEMRRDFPSVNQVPVLGNILDVTKIESILSFYRPQVIFHAAAYKHVPLMESNEDEGVLNNVVGTLSLVTAAETAGVERLVFISTDKAVEPINVMGMTKQVGEWIVQRAAARCGRPYVVVRFGNVLGSTGSVVPLFRAQIVAGGPVTVTHPQVTRYFMTTPEAVRLVLQAAAIGRGGEVFVLDMGQPVRIYDLACDLIRLHGLEPEQDIPIVFSGLRPGEKLHEVLHSHSEQISETSCAGIRVVSGRPPVPAEKLERALEEMERLARERRRRALRDFLVQFVSGT
jgi:FlaA1/EpsC-like NDP-sugar epimerase